MFEYIWYELLQDVYSCTNRGDDYKSYVFTQYLNFYLNYDLLVQYKIWQSDLIQKKKKNIEDTSDLKITKSANCTTNI